jgi:hypothetical protein
MAETPTDRRRALGRRDAVRRPWTTPRLLIHGTIPRMTLRAVLSGQATDEAADE